MLKPYSPMSLGAWMLLIFGAFSMLSFLAALKGDGSPFARLRPPGLIGTIVAILGALSGAFLMGYTGVLLAVTNRPIWADTTLLGLVFLVSGASTSAALLIALGASRAPASGIRALRRFDAGVLVLELAVLVLLVLSLGSIATVWLSMWGGLLLVGVVLVGIVAPLVLHWRSRASPVHSPVIASVLVLIGGFILRLVLILSSEAI